MTECSLTSCMWARFLIGSHTMPAQRHSQPTPTSLGQRCMSVTCHPHFWQNDRSLLRATAVTRGWNGHRKRVVTQSWLWRRKFSCRSCRDSNSQPFGALTTFLKHLLSVTHRGRSQASFDWRHCMSKHAQLAKSSTGTRRRRTTITLVSEPPSHCGCLYINSPPADFQKRRTQAARTKAHRTYSKARWIKAERFR